jgi:hypothetical protein
MLPIDNKVLAKLVKSCRKLGIREFKCQEFEFKLNEQAPLVKLSKTKQRKTSRITDFTDNSPEEIPTDGLSHDELLYWSTGIETNKAEQ